MTTKRRAGEPEDEADDAAESVEADIDRVLDEIGEVLERG